MKTNVSIKFNSIEEYREIESKLIELGYEDECNYTTEYIIMLKLDRFSIFDDNSFWIVDWSLFEEKVYNSLQEFLNDNAKAH